MTSQLRQNMNCFLKNDEKYRIYAVFYIYANILRSQETTK